MQNCGVETRPTTIQKNETCLTTLLLRLHQNLRPNASRPRSAPRRARISHCPDASRRAQNCESTSFANTRPLEATIRLRATLVARTAQMRYPFTQKRRLRIVGLVHNLAEVKFQRRALFVGLHQHTLAAQLCSHTGTVKWSVRIHCWN